MIYDFNLVADYIINYSNKNKIYMSNLKLQKIMYFIQNRFLNNNSELDAEFIAWQHGPIIRKLYNRFSGFGTSQLFILSEKNKFDILDLDKAIIDDILDKTKKVSPWKLVEISHKIGNSWDKIYNNKLGYGNIIPNDMIKQDIIELENLEQDEIW